MSLGSGSRGRQRGIRLERHGGARWDTLHPCFNPGSWSDRAGDIRQTAVRIRVEYRLLSLCRASLPRKSISGSDPAKMRAVSHPFWPVSLLPLGASVCQYGIDFQSPE